MGHTRQASSKSVEAGKSVPPPRPGKVLRAEWQNFFFHLIKENPMHFQIQS